jgi:trk system potassium uptake protein TrkA
MKVIIVGCGKFGSGLAMTLEKKGNEVTIIDSDPEAFELLDKKFTGTKITGIGFDRDVLNQAGITRCDAVVACSKKDETNALIGKLARDAYSVPRVICRLYDPRRAAIYRSFGIETISTTSWGVQTAMDMLSYNKLNNILMLGDSQAEIVRAEAPEMLEGRTIKELSVYGEMNVIAISRGNKIFIPSIGTPIEKNDILYISVLCSSTDHLKSLLGMD